MHFIKTQGVVGLAVGFLLGGAVSDLVGALVGDIINPILGVFLGSTHSLAFSSWKIGPATLYWGHFVAVLIDFIIIALVVYFGVKKLGLDKPAK